MITIPETHQSAFAQDARDTRLQHIGNDNVSALQQAFDGFEFWDGVRAVLQTLAFGANLCSLAAIPQKYESDGKP